MSYSKTHWVDKVTPLSPANFNKIENWIEQTDIYFANVGKSIKRSASFTIAADDVDKVIVLTNTSEIVITVPPNASVQILKDKSISFLRKGTGKVRFATSGAAVLTSKDSKRYMDGMGSMVVLIKTELTGSCVDDVNAFDLIGALAVS